MALTKWCEGEDHAEGPRRGEGQAAGFAGLLQSGGKRGGQEAS